MSFVHQKVVISGSEAGVEGNSAAIAALSTAMQAMGWSVYDDQTTAAGSNMKMVLYNNQSEDPTYSGIYVVLGSGSSQDYVQVSVGTEWNVSAHNFGSAVAIPNTTIPQSDTARVIFTDRDGDFVLWISGDKDSVCVVSRNSGTNRFSDYSVCSFGKVLSFLDANLEPYGVYLRSSAATSPVLQGLCPAIVGNPPQALGVNSGEILVWYADAYDYGYNPWVGQSGADRNWIYTALPDILVSQAGVGSRGAIGVIKHAWSAAEAEAGGLHNETVFYEEESGREYLVFVSIISLLLRIS